MTDVVVITTARLHPTKLELKFCSGPHHACGVSEIMMVTIFDGDPGCK